MKIEEYMDTLSDQRKESLIKLRKVVYDEFPDIEEIFNKNIISFKQDGVTMFAFGSQKQSMCFYFSKAVMLKYKDALVGLNLGKGTIRFKNIDQINKDTLIGIIKEAYEFPFEYSKRGDSTR